MRAGNTDLCHSALGFVIFKSLHTAWQMTSLWLQMLLSQWTFHDWCICLLGLLSLSYMQLSCLNRLTCTCT